MELVEGDNLSHRIAHGAMPITSEHIDYQLRID